MAIVTDIYELKYSGKFDSLGLQESTVDLTLDNATTGSGVITGTTQDTEGNPIPNVTVKLFDADGTPYKHTLTNENGEYEFSELKSGNYSISAVRDGYVITLPYSFFLQPDESKTHTFTLSKNQSLDLCSIAGHIYTEEDDNHIYLSDATVSLLNGTTRETIMTTKSVDDGEYLFYGVAEGKYIIKVVKQGYSASSDVGVTAVNNTIVNTDIKLILNPTENVGTISGIVKHENVVIAGAFVGLYAVNEEAKTETLVAITKTNAQGLYMFGNVVTGKYKVKAKLVKA